MRATWGAWIAVAVILGGCDATDSSRRVARVEVTPAVSSVPVYSRVAFSARLFDADGNDLGNRATRWSVVRPELAGIDALGNVVANAPGVTQVRATSEGVVGVASLSVLPAAISVVLVRPTAATIAAGASVQLNVELYDILSLRLTGRDVSWTSSSPQVATVSPTGLVTAVSEGVATIAVASEGKSASATLTVVAAEVLPTIDAIAPAVLTPGAVFTVTGTHLASNEFPAITLGGAPVSFVTVTPNRLDLMVPCVRHGPADLVVKIFGKSATRRVEVETRQRALAVGEWFITMSATEAACSELLHSGGVGRYVVTVFNNAISPNASAGFELRVGTTASVVATSAASLPASTTWLDDIESRRARVHDALMERGRRDYARFRGTARRTPKTRANARAAPPSAGDLRDIRYVLTRGCGAAAEVIPARAVHVGVHAVVWEDTTNRLQASRTPALDSSYKRLLTVFDAEQYDIVKRYFGDPLIRDAELDNDGRLHMVFSQRINGTGVGAYVAPCDQFPRSSAPGSNEGEYFYGIAPSIATSNLDDGFHVDGWLAYMQGVVAHEVKHIASISARAHNDVAMLEERWIEEGTAGHAEELWMRDKVLRAPWKSNVGYGSAGSGVFCDFHCSEASCIATDRLRRPVRGVSGLFDRLREKLVRPWDRSPFGDGTDQADATFYSSAWSFIRYVADRYATSEETFYSALINSNTAGVANLSAAAGAPIDEMLGGWGLALYLDELSGTGTSATFNLPSWNSREIYAGLATSPRWAGRWSDPTVLRPEQLSPNGIAGRTLRGGASTVYELNGLTEPSQLLDLRSSSSSTASLSLRIGVIRLQ